VVMIEVYIGGKGDRKVRWTYGNLVNILDYALMYGCDIWIESRGYDV
jgi:hypothetical protein